MAEYGRIHGRLEKTGVSHAFFQDFPVHRPEMWKSDTWEIGENRDFPCIFSGFSGAQAGNVGAGYMGEV